MKIEPLILVTLAFLVGCASAPETDPCADGGCGAVGDAAVGDGAVYFDEDDATTARRCTDGDGDGFGAGCPLGDDCDDGDPDTYPGAPEACGGVDRNCDGVLAEGREPCYPGPAGTEGIGICRAGDRPCGEIGCEGATLPADPNDACDGLDNDCDGQADEPDEGCLCEEGLQYDCFGGAPDARDVGACHSGLAACRDGVLGECRGQVLPEPEGCNGIDDDCDGQIDEALEQACGQNVGSCRPGRQRCEAGVWGMCTGSVPPSAELCNGLDDDCDGQVDEGLESQACDLPGRCAGRQSCLMGGWGACRPVGGGSPELCNGLDDDCDGQIDEGIGERACGESDVGICRLGRQACASGDWGPCRGAIGPAAELCNGLDDDCDGQVDEALERSCGSSVGRGLSGTEICVAGTWGACQGGRGPRDELCNGMDDDCDGSTDEALARACGSDVGFCRPGTEQCVAPGRWGDCVGGRVPRAEELCNGVDDDCDGQIDEEVPPRGCEIGIGCQGQQLCLGGGQWGPCEAPMSPETCNGVDDDCDGQIDEELQRPCGVEIGTCRRGVEICQGGAWGMCEGGIGPVGEICDGLDNDCDGIVDEGRLCPPGWFCEAGRCSDINPTE